MKEGEDVAYKQNNANMGRSSRSDRGKRGSEGYSKGNGNWNNSSYKQSVKTERTHTKVINTTPVKIRTDYFDRTAAGRRAERKRAYDRRKREWRAAVKKNVRVKKIKTAFINCAAILFAVGILFTLVYKVFFVANNIYIEGNSVYTEEQIKGACGLDVRENLFSFSSREAAERIYFYCPRIKNAAFERQVPDKVFIDVEEELPVYYSDIHGELFTLSATLRILERTDTDAASEAGLIKLKLQDVSYAVSGSAIKLVSSRAQRYLENTARLVEKSPLKDKLTAIDMTDDFETVMVALDRYRLDFGSQDDLGVKMKLAEAILEDSIFNPENKAIIDLTDTSKTSVIIDNQLEFD